jgi:hypothetical protein
MEVALERRARGRPGWVAVGWYVFMFSRLALGDSAKDLQV